MGASLVRGEQTEDVSAAILMAYYAGMEEGTALANLWVWLVLSNVSCILSNLLYRNV